MDVERDIQEALIDAVKGQNLWHGRSRPTSPAGAATALAILAGLRARGFGVVALRELPPLHDYTVRHPMGCPVCFDEFWRAVTERAVSNVKAEVAYHCPMCGEGLESGDSHFSLMAGPAGDYECR